MKTRGERFDEVVVASFERIADHPRLRSLPLELAVEDVPPSDPAPWEHGVPLARAFPRDGHLPARIVVYRRPVEHRASAPGDLADLVDEVLTENLAGLVGLTPEDLKDR